MPIAHADGRYLINKEGLQDLKDQDQIIFRYCDSEGNVSDETNVNGSIESIAGICNKERNVFGMMPHPERASEAILGGSDGKRLFDSLMSDVPVLHHL